MLVTYLSMELASTRMVTKNIWAALNDTLVRRCSSLQKRLICLKMVRRAFITEHKFRSCLFVTFFTIAANERPFVTSFGSVPYQRDISLCARRPHLLKLTHARCEECLNLLILPFLCPHSNPSFVSYHASHSFCVLTGLSSCFPAIYLQVQDLSLGEATHTAVIFYLCGFSNVADFLASNSMLPVHFLGRKTFDMIVWSTNQSRFDHNTAVTSLH